ncbi:group II truncated hemoglobin [Paracoccus sp. DMF-8]|uniref:group II truncated hemoglobin n=1 Tax=Paracoccus sp. DMF-8 TaxID=3019445 RepID=UPI0023E82728|nr:group II truncated hemoglobin [Paracoccus sp. DMF-8]MDF3607102.1 group II truncated hemoglobin [Paracoccus sp. DMF-8]
MLIAAQHKQSLFHQIGGEDGVRALVETFYDIIEQDADAAPLLRLHQQGHGVAHSRAEQFNYLCGFFGGPQYYVMKHRHARLREIHEHVPIGPEMRDLWLDCMRKAIDQRAIAPALATQLMNHFTRAAEISRNMD